MRKWFHITFSTYGNWLPGDPRGFRSWRHRIHSSGDYKDPPPPGEHAGLHRHARQVMRGSPVTLTPRQRRECALAIVERLSEKGGDVLAVAVGARHVHIQARLEDRDARRLVGFAKQTASHRIRVERPGAVWAARSRTEPVTTRAHQERLFQYIVRHRADGAFVWTFREPVAFSPLASARGHADEDSPPRERPRSESV